MVADRAEGHYWIAGQSARDIISTPAWRAGATATRLVAAALSSAPRGAGARWEPWHQPRSTQKKTHRLRHLHHHQDAGFQKPGRNEGVF